MMAYGLIICPVPFAWGTSADDAMKHIFMQKLAARTALGSLQLNPDLHQLPSVVQEKHFQRKTWAGCVLRSKSK